MKVQYKILGTLVLSSILSMATSAQTGSQLWHGTGTVFLPGGQKQGSYSVDVAIQQITANVTTSKATVTMSDGSTETITQTMTKAADGSVQIKSSEGQGGGACYGENLCEFYIENKACHRALAITVAVDDDGSRRDLITVLKGGKAVSILSEKLVQVK